MTFSIKKNEQVEICYCEQETEAVKIAISNLTGDLKKVINADCILIEQKDGSAITTNASQSEISRILIGTIGVANILCNELELKILENELGEYRKEAYLIKCIDNNLIIIGSDRRGTIYGIYEFCESIGVSPWYFWADVPVKTKQRIEVLDNYQKVDYPSVEYRGIFINDEEELEHWVQLHMEEETIGVKTYEKIFELLLRLKANYIWPAMHVNSFNLLPENGELANKMGIVVGTSHCDMLMRSNNREWIPWITKKGYKGAEYDYSLPGQNREILEEYWSESVKQNRDFEVSYTLGMRGIHDSGFETKAFAGKSGKELVQAKVELLETVIAAQRKILNEILEHDTLKIFVPYKEVLELYDNGLDVPEDMTLIWANDNYGYIRRYPGEKEKKRKGGNGIYYHNSYWGPPGRSYLFICSIPLAHTRNELLKAYQEGIRKIWVMNVGAIKPLEQEIEFYLRFAWEIGKENALTDDVDLYLENWINKQFSGNHGKETAAILGDFSQLTNVRKIEQMKSDIFSLTSYGDEAASRLNQYQELFDRANFIYEMLPEDEKAAFFQLVLMKIHAAYYTNAMYYFADRSTLCVQQGKMQAAKLYTDYSLQFDEARRKLLVYYGDIMHQGKWSGILTPEDFPPPRTAMHPACTPPLSIEIEEKQMIVTIWNDDDVIRFVGPGTKWFEIANAGNGNIEFMIEAPIWITLSESIGSVGAEKRILVTVNDISHDCQDVIRINNLSDGSCVIIPVIALASVTDCPNQEEDGIVVISADTADNINTYDAPENRIINDTLSGNNTTGWKVIKRLGRGNGSIVEAETSGSELIYPVYFTSNGCFMMEIHRFPTLNSIGNIRVGISVDDSSIIMVASDSNDEWLGNWAENTLNNVDKLYLILPELNVGHHVIHIRAIDPYFAFSKFVIYTKERKENNMGSIAQNQQLPQLSNLDQFTEQCYGSITLRPRPLIYSAKLVSKNDLLDMDMVVKPEKYGNKVMPADIIKAGRSVYEETNGIIKIDAANVLAQSEYAYTDNYIWQYCNSESHGRSGLAMYIRKLGLNWENDVSAPSLNYKISFKGGNYWAWVLMKFDGITDSHMTIGLDGNIQAEKDLYSGMKLWRYSAEQPWRWVPIWNTEISEGIHILSIYTLSSGIRFDRIYLTNSDERPPVDAEW